MLEVRIIPEHKTAPALIEIEHPDHPPPYFDAAALHLTLAEAIELHAKLETYIKEIQNA